MPQQSINKARSFEYWQICTEQCTYFVSRLKLILRLPAGGLRLYAGLLSPRRQMQRVSRQWHQLPHSRRRFRHARSQKWYVSVPTNLLRKWTLGLRHIFVSGYNDVLLIPQGATSINIAEIKPSSNYLGKLMRIVSYL